MPRNPIYPKDVPLPDYDVEEEFDEEDFDDDFDEDFEDCPDYGEPQDDEEDS